jgi:hypothetical protein
LRSDAEEEGEIVRSACIPVLLFATYTCAGQTPHNKFPGSLLRGNLLRIADGQPRLESTVTICLVTDPNRPIVAAAEMLADRIFSSIRVSVRWFEPPVCRATKEIPIFMVIWTGTPKTYLPSALGMALPLEGTHAWVFYDRVRESVPDSRVPALLAHVMVHEIAHLLQGTIRHSESGILNAHWSDTEIRHMAFLPLAFTPTDAILIHHGIEDRRSRVAPNSIAPAPTGPPNAISQYVAPSQAGWRPAREADGSR